ncbi:MAG: RagB/SusD family nutrient uptake outer membrane protein [Bacteroidales bacterium]|nr:RagB/SusD family nutrient uptake outer membrane protein [Bacteroidales bacterium]
MKYTIKHLFVAAAAIASFSACNLSLLPTDSIVYEPGGQVIATREDLIQFEARIMSDYRAVHGGMYNIIEDVMTDGFNASSGFGNNYGGVHRTDDSFSSSDGYIDSYWGNHYIVIKDYNVLINALKDKINIPDGAADFAEVVKGEAYMFRAEAYMNLVRHFGKNYDPKDETSLGVPIVLEFDLYARPARNTVHEVYKQIKADLDSAAFFLAGEAGELQAEYPTIDAVNALYARYYLDTKDYANAAAAADKVISTEKYTLSNTADKLKNEFRDDAGTEAIMQLYGSLQESPNATGVYTSMFSSQDHGTCFRSLFLPTKKLIDSYSANDIRKNVWFSTTDYYTEVNGSYYRGDFYTFVKYLGNADLYSGDVPNGVQMCKPFLISEMYLIKAEAEAMLDEIPKAKATINILQAARGANKSGGRIEDIQAEWFRETVGEGMRWTCLKRWGLGFESRTGQPGTISKNVIMVGDYYDGRSMKADDRAFLWPIPSDEIKLNTNLEQNPGYGTN